MNESLSHFNSDLGKSKFKENLVTFATMVTTSTTTTTTMTLTTHDRNEIKKIENKFVTGNN